MIQLIKKWEDVLSITNIDKEYWEDKIQLLKGKILAIKIEVNSNYNVWDKDAIDEYLSYRFDLKKELKYLIDMKCRIDKIKLIKSKINEN